MKLKDQVCIVTGGGSGIGRGAAIAFAQDGAKVAIVGRTESKVGAVKSEIEAGGGNALSFAIDVADYDAVNQMAQTVLAEFGRIDILVNNAGHSSAHRRATDISVDEIRSVVESNLLGTMYCTKAVLPTMLQAKSGTIINVSSLAGVTPGPLSGFAYGPAKAGVINFTAFLNNDLRNTGVRASVVIPGEVATPIMDLRPVPPDEEARKTMVGVEETTAAIQLIASMPPRTNIPELVIRPTMHRDVSKEIAKLM